MLEAHARNPDASYVEGMESPGAAAATAAAAAAADTNGADADSSDDEAAAAAEAAAYDPVDWDAPLAAAPGGPGTVASLAAAEAAAAPWEGEEGEGSGGGAAAGGGGAVEAFVGAAERQRLAAVAELGLRFAEAAAEAGHEGGCCALGWPGLRGCVMLCREMRCGNITPVLPGIMRRRPRLPSGPARPSSPAPCSTPVAAADAARSALGVLVRSAHLLPPALAEQLVFRMGQCRMTGALRLA